MTSEPEPHKDWFARGGAGDDEQVVVLGVEDRDRLLHAERLQQLGTGSMADDEDLPSPPGYAPAGAAAPRRRRETSRFNALASGAAVCRCAELRAMISEMSAERSIVASSAAGRARVAQGGIVAARSCLPPSARYRSLA